MSRFSVQGRWVVVDSEEVEVEVSQEAMGAAGEEVEEANREPETGSVQTRESAFGGICFCTTFIVKK